MRTRLRCRPGSLSHGSRRESRCTAAWRGGRRCERGNGNGGGVGQTTSGGWSSVWSGSGGSFKLRQTGKRRSQDGRGGRDGVAGDWQGASSARLWRQILAFDRQRLWIHVGTSTGMASGDGVDRSFTRARARFTRGHSPTSIWYARTAETSVRAGTEDLH